MNRNPRLALSLVLALYVVAAYVYALIIPVWCDEWWSIIPCWNLINHGFLGMGVEPSLIRPTIHSEAHVYWFPPLYYLSLAGWFKAWGYGLMAARWHTIAWGVVLLVGVWWFTRNNYWTMRFRSDWKMTDVRMPWKADQRYLTGFAKREWRWTGVWAALITALNYNFLASSDARPDMMCAALGIWAVATRSEWFAAGAALCHPYGLLYPITLAILKRKINWIPYTVALAGYGLYAAQAPDIWLAQQWGQVIAHGALSVTAKGCAVYIAIGSGWRMLLMAVFVACAAVTALQYRDMAWCLALLVLPALFLTSSCYYFTHAVPWLALCVAIQMRKRPWLAAVLAIELVFAMTTLIPLWGWGGLSDLG